MNGGIASDEWVIADVGIAIEGLGVGGGRDDGVRLAEAADAGVVTSTAVPVQSDTPVVDLAGKKMVGARSSTGAATLVVHYD